MPNENLIVKDWGKIDISFGLVYPNVYEIGMSSYALRLLYYLINSMDNIACERIFLPKAIKYPASQDYSSKNQLRSIENKILPIDFDILGFSVQSEMDFKNILWFLEKAEIPLSQKKRQESITSDSRIYPILIGGGPVITSNPLPLSDFFDILFIGDAEPNLNSFFKLFYELNENDLTFHKFLDDVSKIEGLYVPSLKNKVKRAILQNLDESPIPDYQLLTGQSREKRIFESNFFIELNRGCPFQCKFCISSFHNSPFRNRSFENIINSIDEGLKYSNFDTISLIGSCVSAHPKFQEICEYIIKRDKRATIPSIRIEHITPDILQIFEKSNIKTITIAPETGSEKLRYSLGKKISNEKIYSVLQLIKDSQIKNVKFYFLTGLPSDKDEDIEEIITLLKNIDKIGFNRDSLRVNVNPFIPKFNTPFGNETKSYLDENLAKMKANYQKLEREFKKIASIKLNSSNFKKILKNARVQAIFSLGDEEVSKLLYSYYSNGANYGALRRVLDELDFSIDDYFLKIQSGYCPWKI